MKCQCVHVIYAVMKTQRLCGRAPLVCLRQQKNSARSYLRGPPALKQKSFSTWVSCQFEQLILNSQVSLFNTTQHYLESLKLKSINKCRISKCSCIFFQENCNENCTIMAKVTRGSWQKPSSRPSKCHLLMNMTWGKDVSQL